MTKIFLLDMGAVLRLISCDSPQKNRITLQVNITNQHIQYRQAVTPRSCPGGGRQDSKLKAFPD